MALSGSTVTKISTSAGNLNPTTPTIYNVSALVAGTEYSQVLTSSTKMFTIRVRGLANLKLAYISGESGTKYITIPRGTSRSVGEVNFSGTLYFQTDQPSQIVEIEEWA